MWKEAVVACFNVPCHNFPGCRKENHGIFQSEYAFSRSVFRSRVSGIRIRSCDKLWQAALLCDRLAVFAVSCSFLTSPPPWLQSLHYVITFTLLPPSSLSHPRTQASVVIARNGYDSWPCKCSNEWGIPGETRAWLFKYAQTAFVLFTAYLRTL
jgi:hypothetical protein